jgi:hypothetical protein
VDLGISLLAVLIFASYDPAFDFKASCHVVSTDNSQRYMFVRVQETETGRVAFQSTLKGKQTRDIFVQSKEIKIDHKLVGDLDYHSPVVANCEGGNTIHISPRESHERALGVK